MLLNNRGSVQGNIGKVVSDVVGTISTTTAADVMQSSNDINTLQRMREELPQYPVWSVGGHDLILSDNSNEMGTLSYRLTLTGTQEMLNAYKMILLTHGFRYVEQFKCAEVMSKMIDGECYAFIFTDAVCDDEVSVVFERNIEYMP